MFLSSLLPAALLLGSHVLAQTSSSCNPTKNDSCPADIAFASDYNFNFNTTPSTSLWTVTAGTVDWTEDGANFTIAKQGDSPTIRTEFYIFGGRVEIWMKAAPGQGIISSVMLLSDDLDEIDLEFLGGNGTAVQTNYFGKGTNNYTWEKDFSPSGGTINDYHNYTLDWKNTSLEWYIDGEHVRSLTPEEANNTHSYPQTPMRVYIGPWAGGDPDNAEGTIAWAGGETDYDAGPFTMWVKNCRITDYSKGTSYSYGDSSGTWDSIQILKYVYLTCISCIHLSLTTFNSEGSNSTASDKVSSGDTTESADDDDDSSSISESFNSLSSGSKAAIIACSGAAALGLVAYAVFYCCRQRKRGQQEAAMAAKRQEEERVELEGYKAAGINPDGFSEATPEYDAKTGMATRDVQVPGDYGIGENEKYNGGGMAMAGAAGRPLLSHAASHSPPGTPGGGQPAQNPYSDGFSPIDQTGFGNLNHQHLDSPVGLPPSGPLPGVPGGANRSFSSPNPDMRSGSVGPGQPNRSFTNPNGGGYWQ